jgi:hypothetical protein
MDRGSSAGENWTVFDFPDQTDDVLGTSFVQWDGGVNYSIHGRSARRLPDLELGELTYSTEWGPPFINVEILADGGYRRDLKIAVDFRIYGDEPSASGDQSSSAEWA